MEVPVNVRLAYKVPRSLPFYVAAVLMALIAVPAMAEGLNWLYPSWEKWVVGYNAKSKGEAITEFIPEGEKIDNWTQLVTI